MQEQSCSQALREQKMICNQSWGQRAEPHSSFSSWCHPQDSQLSSQEKLRDSLSPFSLLHGANGPEPSPALLPSLDVLQPLQVFLEVRDEFRRKHFHKASPDSTKQQLTNLLPVSSQYSTGRNIEGN